MREARSILVISPYKVLTSAHMAEAAEKLEQFRNIQLHNLDDGSVSLTQFPNIIFASVTSIAFEELQNWTDEGLLSRIVVDEAHVIVSDVDCRGDDCVFLL